MSGACLNVNVGGDVGACGKGEGGHAYEWHVGLHREVTQESVLWEAGTGRI